MRIAQNIRKNTLPAFSEIKMPYLQSKTAVYQKFLQIICIIISSTRAFHGAALGTIENVTIFLHQKIRKKVLYDQIFRIFLFQFSQKVLFLTLSKVKPFQCLAIARRWTFVPLSCNQFLFIPRITQFIEDFTTTPVLTLKLCKFFSTSAFKEIFFAVFFPKLG